jgi:hypothetical protein
MAPLEKIVYYDTLRRIAREAVARDINKLIAKHNLHDRWHSVTLASIDTGALDYARLEWPKYYSNQTHTGFKYSWEKLYHKFAGRPAHFNLAVWQRVGDQLVLQAMALGKPSDGKSHLTLNWGERFFGPNYLGGALLLILGCAEEYAKLLGCKRVLIKEPVDPKKYARYLYEPHKLERDSTSYMCKELSYDDPDEG